MPYCPSRRLSPAPGCCSLHSSLRKILTHTCTHFRVHACLLCLSHLSVCLLPVDGPACRCGANGGCCNLRGGCTNSTTLVPKNACTLLFQEQLEYADESPKPTYTYNATDVAAWGPNMLPNTTAMTSGVPRAAVHQCARDEPK